MRRAVILAVAVAGCVTLTQPEYWAGPDPVWTPAAIAACVDGTIVARCVVTAKGRVTGCHVVAGSVPEMDAAVIRALEQRIYKPARLRGEPVDVNYTFRITLEPGPCVPARATTAT